MRFLNIAFLVGALIVAPNAALARGGGGHGGGSHYSSSHVNSSSHVVSGYTRRNGTVVHSYHATDPNKTRNDNYSTRGNTNPYTGKSGTKPRDGD
jgi:glyoxylate carboligase